MGEGGAEKWVFMISRNREGKASIICKICSGDIQQYPVSELFAPNCLTLKVEKLSWSQGSQCVAMQIRKGPSLGQSQGARSTLFQSLGLGGHRDLCLESQFRSDEEQKQETSQQRRNWQTLPGCFNWVQLAEGLNVSSLYSDGNRNRWCFLWSFGSSHQRDPPKTSFWWPPRKHAHARRQPPPTSLFPRVPQRII